VIKVSIIVRSYNDIQYIQETMSRIQSQTFKNFEIINVDSGSKDGTWDIVKSMNTEGVVYQIPPGSYIPGRVLNEAISKSKGEIIVFNNSDCIPQNNQWLAELIRPLENEQCAASFGNQLPRPNATPLVRKDSERAYGDGKEASTWHHFFSLATSAVRKSLIMEYPFDESITYSEDIEWSWRMRQKGYTLCYAKDAIVEHSHNYTLKEVYKRFHGEGVANARIYGWKPNLFKRMLKPFVVESARDVLYLAKNKEFSYIAPGVLYRFLQKYSEYKGIRDYCLKGFTR
jgi:rhamnosyltransferase